MTDPSARPRRSPPWYNLSPANLPVPALVSILNRVSGAGIFLCLFFLLYLLDQSLASPQGFAHAQAITGHWFAKLVLFGLLWAFLHHFCAGIRYLLLDLDKGTALHPARRSARLVLVVSLALTVILGALFVW